MYESLVILEIRDGSPTSSSWSPERFMDLVKRSCKEFQEKSVFVVKGIWNVGYFAFRRIACKAYRITGLGNGAFGFHGAGKIYGNCAHVAIAVAVHIKVRDNPAMLAAIHTQRHPGRILVVWRHLESLHFHVLRAEHRKEQAQVVHKQVKRHIHVAATFRMAVLAPEFQTHVTCGQFIAGTKTRVQFGKKMLTEVQENRVVAFRLRYEKRNATAFCQIHEFPGFFRRCRKRFFHKHGNPALQEKLRIKIMRRCRRCNYCKINFGQCTGNPRKFFAVVRDGDKIYATCLETRAMPRAHGAVTDKDSPVTFHRPSPSKSVPSNGATFFTHTQWLSGMPFTQ